MSLASQRGSQLLRQHKQAKPARPGQPPLARQGTPRAKAPRTNHRQTGPTNASKVKNWLLLAAVFMLLRQLFEWLTGGWG